MIDTHDCSVIRSRAALRWAGVLQKTLGSPRWILSDSGGLSAGWTDDGVHGWVPGLCFVFSHARSDMDSAWGSCSAWRDSWHFAADGPPGKSANEQGAQRMVLFGYDGQAVHGRR
jgi:hypothetical protein